MKRLISILVVLLLLFSVTSVAFASDDHNFDNDRVKKHEFKNWKAGMTKEEYKYWKDGLTKQEFKIWKAGLKKGELEFLKGRELKDRICVNGKFLDYDVPPVIKEGRTLIPVRAVTRGLGADVDWDEETKTVTITRGEVTIMLKLDTAEYKVNGEKFIMDVPAQLICNRTFVPLRFIAQALGDAVNYDPDTGDIEIETPERPTLEDCIAEWEAVDNADEGYMLRLFRETKLIKVVETDSDVLEYDFSDEMEEPGCYMVRVTALSSDTESKESLPSYPQIIDECQIMTTVEGIIVALDDESNWIRISYEEDGDTLLKKVFVYNDTEFVADDEEADFEDLDAGDDVEVSLHQNLLLKLEVLTD